MRGRGRRAHWPRLPLQSARIRFVSSSDSSGRSRSWLAERTECGAELGTEELRLFPRSEVTALVGLVEVDRVAIGAPGPCFGPSTALRAALSEFQVISCRIRYWTKGRSAGVNRR